MEENKEREEVAKVFDDAIDDLEKKCKKPSRFNFNRLLIWGTIFLIILKLANVLTCSWWVIFAPLFTAVFIVVISSIVILAYIIKKQNKVSDK